MTKLGVNVDHVATVRQARQAPEPDPVAAALLAELAGAHGITVHLRQDRRHIRDDDVRRLRESVTTRLNLEMAATEGGLDVLRHAERIESAVRRLREGGIAVSLFIDPEPDMVESSARAGATMIELNTRAYSETCPRSPDLAGPALTMELAKVASAAQQAAGLGLNVLAGHGLTYRNVRAISSIPQIEELNIGHNIIARAVLTGMDRAVREMLQAMGSNR